MEELRWDLTELYPGPDSPELEADLQKAEELAKEFEAEFGGKINDPGLSADLLAQALITLEEIVTLGTKLDAYASLLYSLNTQDPTANALKARAEEIEAIINASIVFFDIEWRKLPDQQAVELIADPALQRWQHALEKERTLAPYTLSIPEEKLLRELSPVTEDAWQRHFFGITGRIKALGRPFFTTLSDCDRHPDRDVRRKAYHSITRALKRKAPDLIDVFNARLTLSRIEGRKRGWENPMRDRNLDNEMSEKAVEALLATCEGLSETVARYYRLKGQILGIPRLSVYDRYAPLGLDTGEISLAETRDLIVSTWTAFSPKMGEAGARMFEERWLDTPAVPGKMIGAFCLYTPFIHPFILMNWTGKKGDALTGAHEGGHAFHGDSAAQEGVSILQFDAPIALAETASVFGERLVLGRMLELTSDPEERLALLCRTLDAAFATVVRQAYMTIFERRIHGLGKYVTTEEANKLWLETQRDMFAGSVVIPDSYGWWWSYVSYVILRPFYSYSYSVGMLVSLALWEKYQHGELTPQDHHAILRAGGSDSPAGLLRKHGGVDIEDPRFWQKGKGILDRMVEEAEELARHLGY